MCDIWGLVPVAAAARPLPSPHRTAPHRPRGEGVGGAPPRKPTLPPCSKTASPSPLPEPPPSILSPPGRAPPAPWRGNVPVPPQPPGPAMLGVAPQLLERPRAGSLLPLPPSTPSLSPVPFVPPAQSLRHHSTQIFRGKPLSPSHPRRVPASPEALGVGFFLGGGGIKDARCGCGPPQTPVSVRPLSVSSAQRSEPPK